MDSYPITTIQNPIFDFITEELLSSGYLHTHVFNDGINNTKELFFDLKNEEWLEKNTEFMKWFEKNTCITQNEIIQSTNRFEYFSVDDKFIKNTSSIDKHLSMKEAEINNVLNCAMKLSFLLVSDGLN